MLEIFGDQVSRLNDEDLRTLVVRLCEAELRHRNLPTSGLTAGGNQTAPDGGIDVRVEVSVAGVSLDFIPRGSAGFQVKCADMPPSKIAEEMRPGGELRLSIREPAITQGAYVIVSSQGSVADSALIDRRNAMRAAIGTLPDGESIHLDFYDRERLATWVRAYPGVALWLRERIGDHVAHWFVLLDLVNLHSDHLRRG